MNRLHRHRARLAGAFSLAVAASLVLALFLCVSSASAYVLSNGCDEYDPARGVTYRCVPDRSTFYTPDGVNPSAVAVGAGYPGEATSTATSAPTATSPVHSGRGRMTIDDPQGIPPPAPYVSGRDYCSNPWYGYSPYEGKWQYTCYKHDVCYGSQLGRKYCDVQFWKGMIAACKSYGWYNPARYSCFADAVVWYNAVRLFGASHYKPRTTSYEPAGT